MCAFDVNLSLLCRNDGGPARSILEVQVVRKKKHSRVSLTSEILLFPCSAHAHEATSKIFGTDLPRSVHLGGVQSLVLKTLKAVLPEHLLDTLV